MWLKSSDKLSSRPIGEAVSEEFAEDLLSYGFFHQGLKTIFLYQTPIDEIWSIVDMSKPSDNAISLVLSTPMPMIPFS